jgi:hypothetical protein
MLLEQSSFEKRWSIRRLAGAEPIESDTISFIATSTQKYEIFTRKSSRQKKLAKGAAMIAITPTPDRPDS